MFVLADLVVLLKLLEKVEAIAADVAHRDARGLGVFVRDLHDFPPPLFVEFRDSQLEDLSLARWGQAEIGGGNRLLDRVDHRSIPDLNNEAAAAPER